MLYPVSYHHHFDRPSGPDYADSYSVRLSLSMLAAATYKIEGADFSNESLAPHGMRLDANRKSIREGLRNPPLIVWGRMDFDEKKSASDLRDGCNCSTHPRKPEENA